LRHLSGFGQARRVKVLQGVTTSYEKQEIFASNLEGL
jgi:hypothetical protein